MPDLENVIRELEKEVAEGSVPCKPKGYMFPFKLIEDALALLKEQELPDVKPEKLEERTTKWLDQMTAEERLEEIAAILDDWDGYRTAKGLAGLINEVWAYALYPVKAQESVEPVEMIDDFYPIGDPLRTIGWKCGKCGEKIAGHDNYCPNCGRMLKWE